MMSAYLRRAHLLARHLRRPPLPLDLSDSASAATSATTSFHIPFLISSLRPYCSPSDIQSPPLPDSGVGDASSSIEAHKKDPIFEDVNNKELKSRIDEYLKADDESRLQFVLDAILRRRLSGKHAETDDELLDEFRMMPLKHVKDQDFESDFSEMHDTDEELDNLYDAEDYVTKKRKNDKKRNSMIQDLINKKKYDKKWGSMIQEAVEHGFLQDTKFLPGIKCEDIQEDMLNWNKPLPDEIMRKTEAKLDKLVEMCERGEMKVEEAYELYKKFEDEMVLECKKLMEAEEPPELDSAEANKKVELDDPCGEGPKLRWESRVVFSLGGDASHPKNRLVKLLVTVKELGLTKHAFRRLREVVGKRYHPGRDELTITSERFEHREENRKDCLRTLNALIDDAKKADKLVEETRNAYVKNRLKANPQFMERLKAKAAKMQGLQ